MTAHSRKTLIAFVKNVSAVPTVARLRPPGEDLFYQNHKHANPESHCSFANGQTKTSDDAHGAHWRLAEGATDGCSEPFKFHTCSSIPRHFSDTTDNSTHWQITGTACLSPTEKVSLHSVEPCCIKCMCRDTSLRGNEPFYLYPEKAAFTAANLAATEPSFVTDMVASANGLAASLERERECVNLCHSRVAAGTDGVIVYPSWRILQPGEESHFFVTFRSSHPQDIQGFIMVRCGKNRKSQKAVDAYTFQKCTVSGR